MASRDVIQVTDVTKVYRVGKMDVHALRGVSLTIGQGDWVAIMGPSGSGKSTLMHIMGCLDTPSSGSYVLAGVEVAGMTEDQLAGVRSRDIGFVFQSFNLLARTTALKQVMLPMQYRRNGDVFPVAERERIAREALERVGLGDRADHLPTELSGGQQQRVAIARALVCNPSILMADEPTGNLDSQSGDEVMEILHRLHEERGLTIVTVTHETYIAEQAGRIVRLRDGRIVEDVRI